MSKKTKDVANQLLSRSPLDEEDAARLILELLETTGEIANTDRVMVLNHCRHVLRRGTEVYARENQTLPFYRAVEDHLRAKVTRRPRTVSEIRQYCKRIMECCPHWRNHPLSSFTSKECQLAVEKSFATVTMQRKALSLLHAIFNFGKKRGLCTVNPIHGVTTPQAEEVRIRILTIPQIRTLLETAQKPEHIACAGALGIMLWAGVRPNEIDRLTWGKINLAQKTIDIEPKHAKTGGARQVTIPPILVRWLRSVCKFTPAGAKVTPRAWSRRWRSLRQDAGLRDWQADTLRHTFASYHLKYFKNLEVLRLEMGHSGTELLRTRYLSMEGLTAEAAKQFWGVR